MKSHKHLSLFIFWSLVIMVIMGMPGNYIYKPIGFLSLISLDKIVHLILFAPWAFFLINYFKSISYENIFSNKPVIWTFVFGIVYAMLTELLQFFVFIGRNGNLYDALADVFGIGLGILIYCQWIKIRKSTK